MVARGETFCVPAVIFDPLQPCDATHDVALVELQVRVEVPPLRILSGFATRLTVGAVVGTNEIVVVAVIFPPSPEQTST